MREIEVRLAERAYVVRIGAGVFEGVGDVVASRRAQKVALVSHAHLAAAHPEVRRSIESAGADVVEIEIPEGEAGKSWSVVGAALEQLAAAELHRGDMVVALGGGVVTDVGGFIAASFLRGVGWIACSTTILGAVDAAVGGKTGVNLAAGKNLAGAFWQPTAVFVDTTAFERLPERQVRSGLAECVKCGFIRDPDILVTLERSGAGVVNDPVALEQVIARGIQVKADIVVADERESGERALLNYGHTFGHALETACRYRLTHGEAISVGMVFAAELAHERAMIDARLVQRHRELLAGLALPTAASRSDIAAAAPLMRRDKKVAEGKLRFVLLESIARPVVVDDVAPAEIERSLNRVQSGE